MAVVRTIVLATMGVSGGLVVPSMIWTPPLQSPGKGKQLEMYELRQKSPLALAGLRIYHAECLDCHGTKARGTKDNPGLHDPRFQRGQKGRQAFHTLITDGAPHQDLVTVRRLSFNQIEQIARYVKEVRNLDRRRRAENDG